MTSKEAAKKALEALGKEELLFSHHQNVYARPEAYARLAEFFEEYARNKSNDVGSR